jgi:hypothetical protein
MTNPISSTSLRSQLGRAWDTLIRAQATDANPAILEVAKAQIKELESQITGASSLSDAERVSLGNSLEAVTSTLGKLAGDNGPSVSQIRFLAGYAIVGTLVAIAVAIPALVSDKVNPVVVVALGALGAFLSYIQSFCQYVGEQKFIRSWFLYYILYPLKGAGLALIIYLLLDTKIVELKIGGGGGCERHSHRCGLLLYRRPVGDVLHKRDPDALGCLRDRLQIGGGQGFSEEEGVVNGLCADGGTPVTGRRLWGSNRCLPTGG